MKEDRGEVIKRRIGAQGVAWSAPHGGGGQGMGRSDSDRQPGADRGCVKSPQCYLSRFSQKLLF